MRAQQIVSPNVSQQCTKLGRLLLPYSQRLTFYYRRILNEVIFNGKNECVLSVIRCFDSYFDVGRANHAVVSRKSSV